VCSREVLSQPLKGEVHRQNGEKKGGVFGLVERHLGLRKKSELHAVDAREHEGCVCGRDGIE